MPIHFLDFEVICMFYWYYFNCKCAKTLEDASQNFCVYVAIATLRYASDKFLGGSVWSTNMTYFDVTSLRINTNTQTVVWFERGCSEWWQSYLWCMWMASYRSIVCVSLMRVYSVACSNSNSIEKRFYSLFFRNFAKVCIQAFRTEFLVWKFKIFVS